jgi:hypothetical protein
MQSYQLRISLFTIMRRKLVGKEIKLYAELRVQYVSKDNFTNRDILEMC